MTNMSHSRLQNMSADLQDFRRALRRLQTDPLSDNELEAAKKLVFDCQITLLLAAELADNPNYLWGFAAEVVQADFGPTLDAVNRRGLQCDEAAAA